MTQEIKYKVGDRVLVQCKITSFDKQVGRIIVDTKDESFSVVESEIYSLTPKAQGARDE